MTLCLLAVVSCKDDLDMEQQATGNPLNQDKGIGELVLFSSGNTGAVTSRANVDPYMELDGRFVCKMYYHAKATDTDADPFETENTPITSWLRVNDYEGNSVYWQNDFDMTGVDTQHQDYKDYGFDSRAQYFYWRNRLNHVFLAYTDFNLLKENSYRLTDKTDENGCQIPASRSLFMYPDANGSKKTKIDERIDWNPVSYRTLVFGMVTKPNPNYSVENKTTWEREHDSSEPYPEPETIEELALKSVNQSNSFPRVGAYYYKLMAEYGTSAMSVDQKIATRNKVLALVQKAEFLSDDEKTRLKDDLKREEPSADESTAEGTFHNDVWWVNFDPEASDIYETDNSSLNLLSSSVVVYCAYEKKKIEEIFAIAPANVFDMRRTDGMNSMADQPDPLIALTKMKPMGATQEANRVRLYFEHQFSQVQVNLTKAKNTGDIEPENIVSVELLGVTETGYVFTTINADGSKIEPTYEPVVIGNYSPEQIKENPHGTSFNMFDMESAKPETSLKSFNAIAFGQLQAIRITWKEEDEVYTADDAAAENAKHLIADANGRNPGETDYQTTYEAGYTEVHEGDVMVSGAGVVHRIIRPITVDDRGQSLQMLKSGYRYVYDFELQRGTIAFIRASIDPWHLSDELNYPTSGIINE